MKKCTTCNIEKALHEYSRSSTGKYGRASQCKSCNKKYRAEWLATKEPHYRKSEALKRIYNIDYAEYLRLLDGQDHKCAICRKPSSEFKKGLSVDHCHSTGKIRGLLCGTCNRWLVGALQEPSLLRSAADYLETSDTGFVVNERYIKSVRPRRISNCEI